MPLQFSGGVEMAGVDRMTGAEKEYEVNWLRNGYSIQFLTP